MSSEDIIEIPAEWRIPYSYSTGKAASKFFKEIRDSKRLMGTKCPKCSRVFLPPRSFCEDDFVEINEWKEVSNEGIVQAFTVTYQSFMGLPDPPYAIALIKPNGSDTSMAHMLGEIDLSDIQSLSERVKKGMRVRAVFRDIRKGSILDIKYFKPV